MNKPSGILHFFSCTSLFFPGVSHCFFVSTTTNYSQRLQKNWKTPFNTVRHIRASIVIILGGWGDIFLESLHPLASSRISCFFWPLANLPTLNLPLS